MTTLNPKKIAGQQLEGWTLDLQTTAAEFLGYNEQGHPQFDTTRTEMGDLLYRLKYRSDENAVPELVEAAANFLLNTWQISDELDGIVPVPPSVTTRESQPVVLVATALAAKLGIELLVDVVIKREQTPQLKDVQDGEERLRILSGKFIVDASQTSGKTLLLFDDIYGSGATLGEVCRVLRNPGLATKVYALALTRKRT